MAATVKAPTRETGRPCPGFTGVEVREALSPLATQSIAYKASRFAIRAGKHSMPTRAKSCCESTARVSSGEQPPLGGGRGLPGHGAECLLTGWQRSPSLENQGLSCARWALAEGLGEHFRVGKPREMDAWSGRAVGGRDGASDECVRGHQVSNWRTRVAVGSLRLERLAGIARHVGNPSVFQQCCTAGACVSILYFT